MAVEHITKRTVDSVRPQSRDVFVWDSELPGFGLKVTPPGKKIFLVQYRLAGLGRRSQTKRLTLGEYGAVTPDAARRMAKIELGKVAQGLDPAAERASRKAGKTVNEFGESYLKDVNGRRKPSTAKEYTR